MGRAESEDTHPVALKVKQNLSAKEKARKTTKPESEPAISADEPASTV